MESNIYCQTNASPIPQVQSTPHSTCLHRPPFFQYPFYSPPHYWFCPPSLHSHVPIQTPPRCPNCLKTYGPPSVTGNLASSGQNKGTTSVNLPIPQSNPEDLKSPEQFSFRSLWNGYSIPPNSSCESPAKQEIDNNTTPPRGQWPHVHTPCVHRPMRPAMHSSAFLPPICPYHHFLHCRVHGCWHPPSLMYPIAGPVAPFSSMHLVDPSKFSYVEPELNRVGSSPTNLVVTPTSSVIGTTAENWHGNGDSEDLQDRAMEDAYEREDEEDEPIFVLTDEWMDFFAKSEARRQEKKKHRQKEAKKIRKAERSAKKKQNSGLEISPSFLFVSEEGTTASALDGM